MTLLRKLFFAIRSAVWAAAFVGVVSFWISNGHTAASAADGDGLPFHPTRAALVESLTPWAEDPPKKPDDPPKEPQEPPEEDVQR